LTWTAAFRALAAATALVGLQSACASRVSSSRAPEWALAEAEEFARGAADFALAVQLSGGATPRPNAQNIVSALGARLALRSSRPKMRWQFRVVESTGPAILGLPGGKIVVSRGLLISFRSQDELAVALGGAIAHVSQGDRGQARGRDAVLGPYAVAEDPGPPASPGIGGLLLTTPPALTVLARQYSPAQERRAGELGRRYAAEASSLLRPEERAALAKLFAAAVTELKAESQAFALGDEARLLASRGDAAGAAAKLERAVLLSPSSPILNTLWGAALYETGDFDRAEKATGYAIRADPSLFVAYLLNASAKWRTGRVGQARPQLDRADELLPEVPLVAFLKSKAAGSQP
jgi:predicted Zn-dependent protease